MHPCPTLPHVQLPIRVCLACVKVTLGRVPPVLALVADRHFFVRAVSLGPLGYETPLIGPSVVPG